MLNVENNAPMPAPTPPAQAVPVAPVAKPTPAETPAPVVNPGTGNTSKKKQRPPKPPPPPPLTPEEQRASDLEAMLEYPETFSFQSRVALTIGLDGYMHEHGVAGLSDLILDKTLRTVAEVIARIRLKINSELFGMGSRRWAGEALPPPITTVWMPLLEHHTALYLKILRDRVAAQHVAKLGARKAGKPIADPGSSPPAKPYEIPGWTRMPT